MSQDEMVIGLDIGSSKICAVAGRYDDDGVFNILGVGNCKIDEDKAGKIVSNGKVVNVSEASIAISRAIEAAQDEADTDIDKVTVGIGGDNITFINSEARSPIRGRGGQVTQTDVDNVIDCVLAIHKKPDEEILFYQPQSYSVDENHGVTNPLNMNGSVLTARAHIVIGNIGLIKSLNKSVNQAGLEASSIVLNHIASANVVLTEEEKELGVVMLDFGANTIDITAFANGFPCFTAVYPRGGEILTLDLAEGCGVTRKKAEELKTQFRSFYSKEIEESAAISVQTGINDFEEMKVYEKGLVADSVEARIKEIVSTIISTLEQEEGGSLWKKIKRGFVITGGTANAPGLCELISSEFDLPARVGIAQNCRAKNPSWISPQNSVAIGLAAYGFRDEESGESSKTYNESRATDSGSSFSNFFSSIKTRLKDIFS